MKLAYTGIFVAIAFAAGGFISSPELRVYAANTVFSTDIVDGEVKTADIATSAVTNAKIAPGAVSTTKIGTGAVGNSNIAANAVSTSKIGAGAVTSSKLATDAVGARELQGVSKLLFSQCVQDFFMVLPAGQRLVYNCSVMGADDGDSSIAMQSSFTPNDCIVVEQTSGFTGDAVEIHIHNVCNSDTTVGTLEVGIITFNKYSSP